MVYYEQDGDEVYQCRRQGEIVNYPDHEILKVNIFTFFILENLFACIIIDKHIYILGKFMRI